MRTWSIHAPAILVLTALFALVPITSLLANAEQGERELCAISVRTRKAFQCELSNFAFIIIWLDDGPKHEILVPEFSIQPLSPVSSFVAISRSFQVGHNLDLEVWFLTRSSDGILAYSAQNTNGRGDFIWLALIGGRVQFRWDLGSGAGIVTWVFIRT